MTLVYCILLLSDHLLCGGPKVLFLAGIIFIIGAGRTYRFFFQSHKLKGTAIFFGGIFLVLIGWPIIGMIIEFYGAFLLFGYVIFCRLASCAYNKSDIHVHVHMRPAHWVTRPV